MTARRSRAIGFPGEDSRYRTARNRLLTAELDLRKRVEQVAGMRRKLPLGGRVAGLLLQTLRNLQNMPMAFELQGCWCSASAR